VLAATHCCLSIVLFKVENIQQEGIPSSRAAFLLSKKWKWFSGT